MMQKMTKRAIRSKSKSLVSNVAVVVLLGLMNVRAVMDMASIQFAEQGTIPFRQKMIKKLDC